MIHKSFAGSDCEPPEYTSDHEVWCATPDCLESFDGDDEGHISWVYDGLVCDGCHEAELEARKRQERLHAVIVAAPDTVTGIYKATGEYV